MSFILIAESGSTKTDWCLVHNGSTLIQKQTQGINPHIQSPEQIQHVLEEELSWNFELYPLRSIHFYGAGTGSPQKKAILEDLIGAWAPQSQKEVHGDMMAAARGLCGNRPGMVSILGTGSNIGYYNGISMLAHQTSLGYIAGDEGSGNHMGKRILQHLAYHSFDEELRESFHQQFPGGLDTLVCELYESVFPNRYLASFVPFLIAHRGHYMVENIIEDCINEFFLTHILKYKESRRNPLHFTGSVAYEFRDKILDLCQRYELQPGLIAASPLEGLIQYHLGGRSPS